MSDGRDPHFEDERVRFLRELADRMQRDQTTDADEYVLDAIDDALDEWEAGPSETDLDELALRASQIGISTTDFVRHAVLVQLKSLRDAGERLDPEAEGKSRRDDLARWVEESGGAS